MLSITEISDEEKLYTIAKERICRRFTLAEIELATVNFDDMLVIGKGGFGMVYKGHIYGTKDSTPSLVAIKRLDSFSRQGASEFMTEIEMLSKLRHCHLVSLIGYCYDSTEMILVYEYMPNGTIEHHLHKDDTPLSWMHRLNISIGAARGIDYLHTGVGTQHGVIHRDVKTSNILLDENWAAKIADFGLSKKIDQPSSGINTDLKGTFGYLDPEYYMTGYLTRKSDVYAFGVVLFELLSGRRAVDTRFSEDEWNLANWAQKCVKERRVDQIVSSHITGQISSKCLKEFTQISDRCLKSSRKERPTMSEVVVALQLSMALQEQFDSSAQPAGATGFTYKMQKYLAFRTRNILGIQSNLFFSHL
ncbi:receptor-like protein kinase FERONIA [Tanacetum coccineum]